MSAPIVKMHHQNQFVLTFYLILNFLCLQIAANQDSHLGPADITVERVEECDAPDMYTVPMGVSMSKVNRTHAGFTACVDFDGSMDETIQLNMTAAKWGDGGWKPNAFIYENVLCETLIKQVPDPWEAFLRAAGAESKCPLPEGKYCVDKFVADLTGLFPSMLYGNFRVDFELLKNEEKYRCIRMVLKSEQTKSS